MVHSRLAISDDGDSDADEFFLPFGQKLGGVGIAVVLAKIGLNAHVHSPVDSGAFVFALCAGKGGVIIGTGGGSAKRGTPFEVNSMGWGLFAIFCWGTLAAAAGSALERTHPAWVLGGAFSAAALVFAFLPRLFGLEGIAEPREAGEKWRGRLLGLWGLFFFHAFYFEAIRRAPIVEATLINYLWPLLIVVLAWRVLREPFRPAIAAGAILGAGGAALVIGGQGAAFEARHLSGYVLALGSALAWSSYTVLLRKWGGGREFLLPASAGSVLLSAIWLIAAGLPEAPSAPAWGAIAYLGVVAVGMAILAWERAVAGGQVAALGAMAYLAPFLSAFFLWLILGKPIGVATIAGMALIVAGGAAAAQKREAGRGPIRWMRRW